MYAIFVVFGSRVFLGASLPAYPDYNGLSRCPRMGMGWQQREPVRGRKRYGC